MFWLPLLFLIDGYGKLDFELQRLSVVERGSKII